jgi:ABC-type multidrug transport system ATPase subunit
MVRPVTLTISHLSKTYANGVRALDDVSLTIAPGMFGLLGPNGAGKSTLMRTIATLQPPDAGTIHFRDIDVRAQPERLRDVLGYLPQDFGLYPTMSAEAILDHFARLKGVTGLGERRELVAALLEQVNLYDDRLRAVGEYSGGMKQRLGIAIALAGRPQLLIVDEPTAGLDPAERNRLLALIAAVGENVVVMLSTHIVDDVQQLCTQMAILEGGRIVAHGAPKAMLETVHGRVWRRTIPRARLDDYRARLRVLTAKLVAGEVALRVACDHDPGDDFEAAIPELEDCYFYWLNAPEPQQP